MLAVNWAGQLVC